VYVLPVKLACKVQCSLPFVYLRQLMSVNGNSQLPLSVSDDLESVGTSPAYSLPALGAELIYTQDAAATYLLLAVS